VHPGYVIPADSPPRLTCSVENTLKGFSYALVEFDGELAKDGSNLPVTIPTRKDVTQGDGRPVSDDTKAHCASTRSLMLR